MAQNPAKNDEVEAVWRSYLTAGASEAERRNRRLFKALPGTPRCRYCYAPFQGAGAWVVRLFYGKRPSNLNPRLCNICEEFARQHQGGAEIELTLLFADVRGSTTIAEKMSPTDFGQLINHFYQVASQIMIQSDALIDKIIGDQAAGMYVPGVAGPDHAQRAVKAAQEMLRATGHGTADGPWIPLGIGIHTGIAFVGAVGSDVGTVDITVLGDAANTASRLASNAAQGEILISEPSFAAAGLQLNQPERRTLTLKGKSDAVTVCVLKEQ